jgi:hypothetical protein
MTVGFTYNEAVHGPMMPILRKAATDRTEFSVGQIRPRPGGNRIGLTTYTGILTRVTPAEGNTNAGAALASVELVFSCEGVNG